MERQKGVQEAGRLTRAHLRQGGGYCSFFVSHCLSTEVRSLTGFFRPNQTRGGECGQQMALKTREACEQEAGLGESRADARSEGEGGVCGRGQGNGRCPGGTE